MNDEIKQSQDEQSVADAVFEAIKSEGAIVGSELCFTVARKAIAAARATVQASGDAADLCKCGCIRGAHGICGSCGKCSHFDNHA